MLNWALAGVTAAMADQMAVGSAGVAAVATRAHLVHTIRITSLSTASIYPLRAMFFTNSSLTI